MWLSTSAVAILDLSPNTSIIAYGHVTISCEFEFRSWRGVLDAKLCDKSLPVTCFVMVLRLPPTIKLTDTI